MSGLAAKARLISSVFSPRMGAAAVVQWCASAQRETGAAAVDAMLDRAALTASQRVPRMSGV